MFVTGVEWNLIEETHHREDLTLLQQKLLPSEPLLCKMPLRRRLGRLRLALIVFWCPWRRDFQTNEAVTVFSERPSFFARNPTPSDDVIMLERYICCCCWQYSKHPRFKFKRPKLKRHQMSNVKVCALHCVHHFHHLSKQIVLLISHPLHLLLLSRYFPPLLRFGQILYKGRANN